jgi:hypothetical protein
MGEIWGFLEASHICPLRPKGPRPLTRRGHHPPVSLALYPLPAGAFTSAASSVSAPELPTGEA